MCGPLEESPGHLEYHKIGILECLSMSHISEMKIEVENVCMYVCNTWTLFMRERSPVFVRSVTNVFGIELTLITTHLAVSWCTLVDWRKV